MPEWKSCTGLMRGMGIFGSTLPSQAVFGEERRTYTKNAAP